MIAKFKNVGTWNGTSGNGNHGELKMEKAQCKGCIGLDKNNCKLHFCKISEMDNACSDYVNKSEEFTKFYKSSGLTAKGFAEKLGVSHNVLKNYLCGRTEIPAEKIKRGREIFCNAVKI